MNTSDVDRAEAVSDVERCPECRELVVPIAYGYPGPEMFEAAERGEIVLGGCTICSDNPTHSCPCGATTSGSLGTDDDLATEGSDEWITDDPIAETEVINRARLDDTAE